MGVRGLSFVKLLRVFLNILATALTLITLRENAVLTAITGRYDAIRQRLRDGSISTEISEGEYFRLSDLATPQELAEYNIITTPRRDPNSIGEYRSVCTNINTNSAPMMISYNDDFWGRNARRVQIYVYSISAPFCEIINVKPAWRDACVAKNGGNATLCYGSILSNFTALRQDRSIRQLAVKDFGVRGVPLMRCLGRPLVPFSFKADLLAHQTYWSGGEYHLTIQTSLCRGKPLVRADNLTYTLFLGENVDEGADMLVLLPPDGWFALIVARMHSVVTLGMIARGILLALFRSRAIRYLPKGMRFSKDNERLRYFAPFMGTVEYLSGNERAVITFKGSALIASDTWMSHWLYMYLCILEAITNIRLTYVTFQVSTSLLLLKVTPVSVLFLLTALFKIAWIMCLMQTLVRVLVKFGARVLRSARVIKSETREAIARNIDGISMFLSYRLYNLLLILLVVGLLIFKGDPSFQVRTNPYKLGEYGGVPDIVSFWGSEIAADLFTTLLMLTAIGQCLGAFLYFTKYRRIADNSVMRLLQDRFVISGWDGLMAADILGLDKGDSDTTDGGGVARTSCSIGDLLQLLLISGPSGFIHFGGDYIFHDGGFSKEPFKFRYTVPKALSMKLFLGESASAVSKVMNGGATYASAQAQTGAPSNNRATSNNDQDPAAAAPAAKTSIFLRYLRLVSEGPMGPLLLVDATNSGRLVNNKETGAREYEVVDALTTMTILDIKWLLGTGKKLRIE